jgi:hypothetical protein
MAAEELRLRTAHFGHRPQATHCPQEAQPAYEDQHPATKELLHQLAPSCLAKQPCSAGSCRRRACARPNSAQAQGTHHQSNESHAKAPAVPRGAKTGEIAAQGHSGQGDAPPSRAGVLRGGRPALHMAHHGHLWSRRPLKGSFLTPGPGEYAPEADSLRVSGASSVKGGSLARCSRPQELRYASLLLYCTGCICDFKQYCLLSAGLGRLHAANVAQCGTLNSKYQQCSCVSLASEAHSWWPCLGVFRLKVERKYSFSCQGPFG